MYIYVCIYIRLAPAAVGLRGEYAERRKKYDIILQIRLNMEYPRAYKWNIIEYPRIFNDIPFMCLPQEYAYQYSPCRAVGLESRRAGGCPQTVPGCPDIYVYT